MVDGASDFSSEDDFALYDESRGLSLLTEEAQERLAGVPSLIPAWVPERRWNEETPCYSGHLLTEIDEEAQDLSNYLSLTPSEIAVRHWLVRRIRESVVRAFPRHRKVELHIFGSFGNGLAIPSSDLDLSVSTDGHDFENPVLAVETLFHQLIADGMLESGHAITHCHVPIVKGICPVTGLSFDISFTSANGVEHKIMALRLRRRYPLLTPLMQILKLFFDVHHINEPYHGGVGGYLLLNLVSSFFASREHTVPSHAALLGAEHVTGDKVYSSSCALGRAFLEFLDFITSGLNLCQVTIHPPNGQTTRHPVLMEKWDAHDQGIASHTRSSRRQNQSFLCVADPQEPAYDIGPSAYNFTRIRATLANAYLTLMAGNETNPPPEAPTRFSRILFVPPSMSFRRQRSELVTKKLSLDVHHALEAWENIIRSEAPIGISRPSTP